MATTAAKATATAAVTPLQSSELRWGFSGCVNTYLVFAAPRSYSSMLSRVPRVCHRCALSCLVGVSECRGEPCCVVRPPPNFSRTLPALPTMRQSAVAGDLWTGDSTGWVRLHGHREAHSQLPRHWRRRCFPVVNEGRRGGSRPSPCRTDFYYLIYIWISQFTGGCTYHRGTAVARLHIRARLWFAAYSSVPGTCVQTFMDNTRIRTNGTMVHVYRYHGTYG